MSRPIPPATATSRPIRRHSRQVVLLGIVAATASLIASSAVGARSSAVERSADPTGAPSSAVVRLDPASVEGVRILLTNDDGVQPGPGAVGLFQLRHELCAAGADVTVVAPWLDRSGASASITYGDPAIRFTLTEPEIAPDFDGDCEEAPSGGPVWGACITPAAAGAATCGADSPSLTPADAVTLGATAAVQELVGWVDGPELIISGTNRGGNDGLNVNISGTLGAATIGISLGYPSIAISASSSGSASANSQAAAEWAVGFVGTLAANDLLPADYVLSVNYPRTDRQPITDAVWAPVAQMSPFATGYRRDGLTFESVFAFCADGPRCGPPEPGSDSAVYSAGNIAVSPISVNRTVGATADVAVVKAVVESGAVSPVPPERPGNRPIVVPPGQTNRPDRPGR